MTTLTASAALMRRGFGLIVLAALMWGTVGVATKLIYDSSATNALSIGFYRLLFSIPALAIACWWQLGRESLVVAQRDRWLFGLIGVMMALYQVCYFAAIPRVGVAVAVLITLCSAPAIVTLLAAIFLGERLTRVVVLSLICAVAGTALLVGGGSTGGSTDAAVRLFGVLLASGSALGYAVLTLCSRALANRYHALVPITYGFATGALVLLPFALGTGLTVSYPAASWGLLLWLGFVPTALAYVCFLTGMRTTSATTASIITLLEPLTSSVLAWVLFGEQLGPIGAIGAVLLLSAIGLLYRRE